MEEEFRKFSTRVYTTECARFEGYRRMKRRKLSSTVSLALLSLSIIVFNILQLCDGYERYNQSITAVTIMLSVLVLVLSLLVSYLNYSEKEMKYYECGLKLSALCDEIDLALSENNANYLNNRYLRVLKDKYQRIIGECGINHIAIDHKRAKLRINQNTGHTRRQGDNDANPKNEIGGCERFCIWWEWNIFDVNFLYWLLALGVPYLAWRIVFRSDVFDNTQNILSLWIIFR